MLFIFPLYPIVFHFKVTQLSALLDLFNFDRIGDASTHSPLKLSAFTVARPLGLYRLSLIQSLTAIIRLDPSAMLVRVPREAWAVLTDAFFEYRFNSIYQRLYCDLLDLAVHNNCTESLRTLLIDLRLMARIIERYQINAEAGHQEDAQVIF